MVCMRRLTESDHGVFSVKECVYCRLAFTSEENFREHTTTVHGMPDLQISGNKGSKLTQTELRGNLKNMQLPIEEMNLIC